MKLNLNIGLQHLKPVFFPLNLISFDLGGEEGNRDSKI